MIQCACVKVNLRAEATNNKIIYHGPNSNLAALERKQAIDAGRHGLTHASRPHEANMT
jgi:hypothetical protein